MEASLTVLRLVMPLSIHLRPTLLPATCGLHVDNLGEDLWSSLGNRVAKPATDCGTIGHKSTVLQLLEVPSGKAWVSRPYSTSSPQARGNHKLQLGSHKRLSLSNLRRYPDQLSPTLGGPYYEG